MLIPIGTHPQEVDVAQTDSTTHDAGMILVAVGQLQALMISEIRKTFWDESHHSMKLAQKQLPTL